MSSIRGKIRVAYTSLAFMVLLLCGIAVFDLLYLESQVQEGVTVSELYDAVSEMRRQEKNLFLYDDRSALLEAERLAASALELLSARQETVITIGSAEEFTRLHRALQQYRQLLAGWQMGAPATRLESAIRDQGHGISTAVIRYTQQERELLAASVRWSRWWLLLSILIIGILVYLVGRRLSHAVVSPIRELESRMMPIAEGRFDHLEVNSQDREFIAFTEAFNRMLKELESRRKRLQQSEKLASLGTLVAGVAHELNNPLSNISSSCQLLLEELDSAEPEQLNRWLKQIDQETDRARNIVLALLEYGRQREPQKEQVRLTEIIDKTRTLASSTLRKNSAQLEVQLPQTLSLSVDPHRLQQVFINLLRNAVDSGGKGVRISITASACGEQAAQLPDDAVIVGEPLCNRDSEAAMTEIIIDDNGPGIPAEVLPHIFEPFYTTREPGHGMGLGLYIIQEIIRENDGCIAVVSRPGRGTRIILRLPCHEED